MAYNIPYTATNYHISKIAFNDSTGKEMWIRFPDVHFGTMRKRVGFWVFSNSFAQVSTKEKYPDFNNDEETAYLNDRRTIEVDLHDLNLSEGQDFVVEIKMHDGNTETFHCFTCHYSNFSDAKLTINANNSTPSGRMSFSFQNGETDHANNHIRYFEGKINGIYAARINVRYKTPGSTKWKTKKSAKHSKGYNVKWDCGVGEIDLPNNTEVQLQLDIVWGHTRNARETYIVRRDSTRTARYEATGTTLNEGFVLKSYG